MDFNRFIILVFGSIVLLSACKKDNQFTVSGKITHAEGETIYLEELLVSSSKPIAKVEINKKGEFKLKGEASIPTFHLLKLSDNNFITLLIDSAENVVVEADAVNFSREYNVEGSLGSIQVRELDSKLNSTKHKLDSIGALNRMYQGNPDYINLKPMWENAYDSIVKAQVEYSNNFVMRNPFSMASVLALYQVFNNQDFVIKDLQTMKTAASALNSIYPNSEHVKALYQNALDFVNQENAAKVQRFIEEQGTNSPEIILPNQDGKEIALSSLRGKIVLIQFWSALDRGSRILNPLLVDAYKKYKNKGFEIYQISIDDNRIEWIDAIDQDKLTWINVGDMEGSVQATQVYNIKSIPYNYLLDKEGVIVGQNLTGPNLDKTLAKFLK